MAKSNMDYNSAEMPPIPTRSHHLLPQSPNPSQSDPRRRSLPGNPPGKRLSVPPASPEVISNLITSLSVISKPASSHFDAPPAQTSISVPSSPGPLAGSFGVDYGAYSKLTGVREDDDPVSLDELAASAPVIRTAKPPSGFSPLTAPKSPRSPSRDSGGFRSFIRSSTHSRPSSKGSLASKNDDTHSIGNLSIERSSNRTPDLAHRRSHDSWGKKLNRSSKGLMYMSSKERLREKDIERRRASTGTTGNASVGGSQGGLVADSQSNHGGSSRNDPFLAETAISEEPNANGEMSPSADIERPLDSPRHIPARDSSLRKTSASGKRTSARRSKRDSDGAFNSAIPEDDEQTRGRNAPRKKPVPVRSDSDFAASEKSFYWGPGEHTSPSKPTASASRQVYESSQVAEYAVNSPEEDDGAPFPAVSQGRRRDDHTPEPSSRRLSGRHSPGPNEGIRMKRSSSRLKRLSGPLSPRGDDRVREPSTDLPQNAARPPVGYERPDSADSVDDAVESYLCSPRLSQKIRHPQTGRVISFSEVGDSEGSAVFCCVGMGLTRYIMAFYDELALTLKLRLITPDRPGVGDSESYTDGTATPLSWPDDVYAICQTLKITKFSILAHSAGAIYALATALRMPQHIRGRIHLLAPWIPPSQMNVFGGSQALPPTNAIPTSQRILRALPTPILKAANSSFMTATSSSITSSLPKTTKRSKRKASGRESTGATGNRNVTPSLDKENIDQAAYSKDAPAEAHRKGDTMTRADAQSDIDELRPPQDRRSTRPDGDSVILAAAADAMVDKERQETYDIRLTQAIWELATTGANPAVDLLVCLERRHTIGFRYVDITRPVVIHHGSRDTRVPVDNVRWLGKTMRRCEVRVLEGEGHGLMASAGVMGGVLMEMSKEWEDWIKVTGSNDGRRERERGRKGSVR